jgi:CBS domain-containing protein
MTQVAQVMTRGVRSMAPTDNLQLAAQAMDELNVGVIPVCEGDKVIGMVTDRDIIVRAVAQGLPADRTPLADVMSAPVEVVHEDDDLEAVSGRMQDVQIRRLPVLDSNDKLVGILSLGDIAAKADSDTAGIALADISEPAEPDRSANSAASGNAGGGSASGEPSSRRQSS